MKDRLEQFASHGGAASLQLALAAPAVDARTKLAVGLVATAVIGAAIVMIGAAPFASCTVQPVALRFGENAVTQMIVTKGSRCSLQVETGAARIEELTIASQAGHGDVLSRGRTGVIYQPIAHFTGEDSFAFDLRGRTARGHAKMTVRVTVLVK
jgi:hypothetical protein